jgi:archaellum biogenesis protein FlaJ (TadC family)
MTFQLYLTCFIVAFVGMLLHAVLKLKSLQDKARIANVAFKPKQYFVQDWLSHTASLLTIVMFLIFTDNILHWKPQAIGFLKIGYAFIGYTGSDIASRLFGVVNKKINTAIDYKTTVADATTGDLDAPTAMPKKPNQV